MEMLMEPGQLPYRKAPIMVPHTRDNFAVEGIEYELLLQTIS